MPADVAGYIACDRGWAASLLGGFVRATDRRRARTAISGGVSTIEQALTSRRSTSSRNGLGSSRRTRADENGPHRRRPPLAATLRRWYSVGIELTCDLAEALAFGVLIADACDYLGR